ncbi:MAG: group II intron reverse transcriptase/maturase [Planctomycetota bacterium]
MGGTSRSQTISTKLQGIAEQAVRYPDMVFTTLVHLIDEEFLKEAYRLTRKKGSPGVDKVTAEEYSKNLDENLRDLHERLRSGQYKAPPVERAWIDKDDGSKRPIGKPTFEDKIVQRAVVMLLGAIYEQKFYDFSHGFRKGHSPHQALQQLWKWCMDMNINCILDADVSGFFDNLDHGWLRKILKQRVNDGGLLRLIGKWLNAGVMEEEMITYPEKGTPQGGVVSPTLANIFLHHVLDDWFVKEVKPRMKGRCFLIRFADDFVIGFEREGDAHRVMDVLPKRFNRYGLTIHPKKTALIPFRKPALLEPQANGNGTFDFLGFTHYWEKSRRGYWVIKRKTAKKRYSRTVKSLWQWCRVNRHLPLEDQHRMLCLKIRGHFQYYGIRGNMRMLTRIPHYTRKAWQYWLSRRCRKGYISWEKFETIITAFPFPKPKIVHNI